VSVRISAAERDALYDQIYVRLSGIDHLWLVVQREDWETAERLAREYIDELRLVLDDLGWGETSNETLELTTPPEVLRRVLGQIQRRAEGQARAEEEEWVESRLREEQRQQVMDACRRVLAEL
jgi:hypothetical protein